MEPVREFLKIVQGKASFHLKHFVSFRDLPIVFE